MSSQASPYFARQERAGELASFSLLLRGRSIDWSEKARALKYDMEFKPVELERKRVAGELHDQVLPLLSRLSRLVHSEKGLADVLGEEISCLIDTVRHLLGELHPVDLEELGLAAALNNLCCRYSKLHGNQIVFRESGEQCNLSEVQQVAVYRALQLVLRMFAQNGAGTLIISCETKTGNLHVKLSLRDHDHSAVKALISEMTEEDLDSFAGWSTIAQMQVQLVTSRPPHCVIFSACLPEEKIARDDNCLAIVNEHNQARLAELENVVTAAQEEWAQMLNRDLALAGNIPVTIERQRICRTIEELVYPGLDQVRKMAHEVQSADQFCLSDRSPVADILVRLGELQEAVENVVTAKYPQELFSLTLTELIGQSVEKLRRATLISARIVAGKVDQLKGLSLEKKISLFRIIHEALHNVEKHSQATTVLVLVEPAPGHLVICVEDNGLGMGESTSPDSRGMRSIKERAREIGASVSWQKAISYESGTLVTITLPTC